MKNTSFIVGTCLLCMAVLPINAQSYTPEEVQQGMSGILYEIEQAAGIGHEASEGISRLDEQSKKALYDAVDDKAKFINAVNSAMQRIEAAKTAPLEAPESSTVPAPEASAATPFTPNYPPTYSAAYNIVKTLGLTSSNEERCDGVGLEIYEDTFYAAEKVADVGDAACTLAGCDPTGIGCAIVCGVVETYKLAVLVAKIPLDSCDKHSAGVDSAEVEAGYENSTGTLDDLSASLSNQNTILNNQNVILLNQQNFTTILDNQAIIINNQNTILLNQQGSLANQEAILENQDEIIRLLNTPQGKRPVWNE